MIRIMYYAEKFGYVGDEYYNKSDESVMMKTVAIACMQSAIALNEPVSFKVVEIT